MWQMWRPLSAPDDAPLIDMLMKNTIFYFFSKKPVNQM